MKAPNLAVILLGPPCDPLTLAQAEQVTPVLGHLSSVAVAFRTSLALSQQ